MPEPENPKYPSDLPTEPYDHATLAELVTASDPDPLPDALTKNSPLGWDLNHDGELTGIETKVPEPAVVRGVLAAVAPLAGLIIGHQLDLSWIDQAVAAYAVIAPVALGFWIRSKVTPVKK